VHPYNVVPTLDETVAVVIVEPVAANMGLVPPADGFLTGLRAECDRVGALLLFDEVITGFRLGVGGATGWSGVTPDLWCFGKVIGGGLPVGAFGASAAVMSSIAPLGPVYQAGTLSGNPLATAAGLAVLSQLDASAYERLVATATALAVVGTGTVAVSYYDPSASELRFARRISEGQWSAEVLQTYAFGAAYVDSTAVAIGPDGTRYVAWCDNTDLKLAWRGAGGWQSENITRCSRGRTRLVVDGQSRVHVAHWGTIYGLRDAAGTWTMTTLGVENLRSTSGFTGLAVDGRGQPHLVFTDTAQQLIYYLAPRG